MKKELIKQIEEFEKEISEEAYKHNAGFKDDLELTKIFNKYKDLFTEKNIKNAKKDFEKSKDRRKKLIYVFFVDSFVGNKLKKLSEEIARFEAKSNIIVEGKKIPYRQVPVLIMNEPDRIKRQKLSDACRPVKKVLTRKIKTEWKKEYNLIKKLTGKKYLDFCSFYKEIDYAWLEKQLIEFLNKTDKIFYRIIKKNFASVGVKIKNAKQHDYAFYSRAKPFDKFFTKEKLIPSITGFWKKIGFDIKKQKNIVLDTADRPKKTPRAFCSPINAPEKVILVIKPHGGQDDYQAFLHESGHTQHFANSDKKLPYEFRQMGSNSVSETYAFLAEYLLADKEWLKKYIKMNEKTAKEFSIFIMEQKLYFLRRYSAKVIYEIKLHNNNLKKIDNHFRETKGRYKSKREMYKDILTKATKIIYSSENYLLDVDSGMYSADYVMAWLFEVMLRKKLKQKFSGKWFNNRNAGVFLKKMWECGNSGKNIYELAKLTGNKEITIKPLEKEIIEFFKNFS